MICERVERALDAGDWSDELAAHAAGCARCAAAVAAMEQIDALFAAPSPSPPATLVPAVMRRVALWESARPALAPPRGSDSVLPWWVRAAAQPGAALALVLGALLAWQHRALVALAQGSLLLGTEAAARWSRAPEWVGRPDVLAMLALVGAMLSAVASWSVYRWIERRVASLGRGA